ncbi:hypothetical protein ECEC1865_6388, partial [Escherichia coli EC1865]
PTCSRCKIHIIA